jgi:Predicted solute binding protein
MSNDLACPEPRTTKSMSAPLRRRHPAVAAVLAVLATGCATTVAGTMEDERGSRVPMQPSSDSDGVDTANGPTGTRSPVQVAPATSLPAAAPSTHTPMPTTSSSTTSTSTTSTTEPDPLADVHDPMCVRIADEFGYDGIAAAEGSTTRGLWIENGFGDAPTVGELVDVCVDNGINDITGDDALRHDDPVVEAAVKDEVQLQQQKLNELFAPFGTTTLAVDGISGPLTGQRLCAARVALGLEPSVADLQPGSIEHAALFAATELPTPTSSATESERWALIDRTCQWMFVGTGSDLVFAFPTSTGSEGFETRTQDRAAVFRYNPAADNGGWHDSTEYPVGVDNPLNGNLYKPLYFDLGQAIHGANNVPPEPASKGCARLSVANQERLLAWLDLLDANEETWRKNEINFTVSVQGDFVGR